MSEATPPWRAFSSPATDSAETEPEPAHRKVVPRWLVPLLLVTAGYLLWAGAQQPGGAFQAGALLASASVLLRLSGRPGAGLPGPRPLRWLLAGGVATTNSYSLPVHCQVRKLITGSPPPDS